MIVTNQAGIAAGLIAPGFVEETHAEMRRRLAGRRRGLDGWYYCPHHPAGP